MIKAILILLVAAGAGWWYFIGGRQLSEDQVRDFYRSYEAATIDRQPEALCALLDSDFHSSGTMTGGGQRATTAQDKAQTCAAWQRLYATWEQLGEKMGGTLQLDSDYTLHRIAIAPDRKSATVDIRMSLDVAGSVMNLRSRTTDTLVRRNGKVLMLRSEGTGSVSAGG